MKCFLCEDQSVYEVITHYGVFQLCSECSLEQLEDCKQSNLLYTLLEVAS